MSGFVFNGSADPAPSPAPIENDGFFPDIDPAALAAEQRIDVVPARLRAAIVAAIITIGNDLRVWRAAALLAGHATLADVPAPRIDGESRNVLLYRRAIGATTKADLVERYRDVDTTGAGDRRADALDPSIGELRRDAIHAVRDILGRNRTDVELI